jgi:hypothetical protein
VDATKECNQLAKSIADLNDVNGDPIIVVIAHVTHLTAIGSDRTQVYFSGGDSAVIQGTVSEIVQKLWPAH